MLLHSLNIIVSNQICVPPKFLNYMIHFDYDVIFFVGIRFRNHHHYSERNRLDVVLLIFCIDGFRFVDEEQQQQKWKVSVVSVRLLCSPPSSKTRAFSYKCTKNWKFQCHPINLVTHWPNKWAGITIWKQWHRVHVCLTLSLSLTHSLDYAHIQYDVCISNSTFSRF